MLEQDGHLRAVHAADRLHAREVARRPGTGRPVGPAEPDITVLVHEIEHGVERREAGWIRGAAEFAKKAALSGLPQPLRKARERLNANRLAGAIGMSP